MKEKEDPNGKHNGYDYITYYNIEDAEKAIEKSKNKTIFNPDNVEVEYFQKRNELLIPMIIKKYILIIYQKNIQKKN